MARNDERRWLITGASKGFGQALALRALRAGDRVLGIARTSAAFDRLRSEFPSHFVGRTGDVRNLADLDACVSDVAGLWGGLDVLVNNAGRGLFGAVEEVDHSRIVDLFQLNVFAVCHLTKVALPLLRRSDRPRIVNLSSAVGQATMPFAGLYSATKHSVEAISEALAGELESQGIPVVLVEPGYFRTDFAASMDWTDGLPQYKESRDAVTSQFAAMPAGDPQVVVEAIWEAVHAAEPPRRVPVGVDAVTWMTQSLKARLAQVDGASYRVVA